jgi:hypothetical protein
MTYLGETSRKEMDEALKVVPQAILKIPAIRTFKRNLEKMIVKKIPLSKPTITAIGSTVISLQKGEIDTKVIKKMDFDVFKGRMRPDLKYNIKNQEATITSEIKWKF